MPPISNAPARADPRAVPAQRAVLSRPPQPIPGPMGLPPFSVIVLASPASPLAEHIEHTLREVGATTIRYASSPADLLRGLPDPVETGVGVICRSPHAEAVPQLVAGLRRHGWRRLVLACHDGDDAAVRLAIAAKVRCLVRRYEPGSAADRGRRESLDLSAREVEVLQAVADGRTNNEVGELLGLSGLTVKSHLARIGRKTGTGDRAEMVAMAMRAGLVT